MFVLTLLACTNNTITNQEIVVDDPFERIAPEDLQLKIDTWFWECSGDEWSVHLDAIGPAESAKVVLVDDSDGWSITKALSRKRNTDPKMVWHAFEAEISGLNKPCVRHGDQIRGAVVVLNKNGQATCHTRNAPDDWLNPLEECQAKR